MSLSVAIVKTGTANLRSVATAFERLGALVEFVDSPEQVCGSEHLVLPGVGAFAAAMDSLQEYSLIEPLRERIERGQPTLAICLGMQIMATSSEESPGISGLGALPVSVRRISPYRPDGLAERGDRFRVPHMGWNAVGASETCRWLRSEPMYFANSFALYDIPEGWAAAMVDHGGLFVAAIERGGVLACQFHPELSGQAGHELLQRWLTA